MESSCISADNTIQPSYMREAPSTLSASAYFDCDNYHSRNLDDTYWGNEILSIPASFCNTPMETGSQQEQVVAKDEDPEFKELSDQVLDMENVYGRKLSSLGQNIPDSFCNTPMETGSQQEQVIAKDEDPEFKELADQVLEWEAELLDLEDKKRESMYKTEEVNVYGRKLSSLGQNIPDSFCNTPMETGSQQEQVVAKDEDPEFKKLSDQLLEWEDELLDLEDKKRKRESMDKTEEVNVYGSKLSSLGQNIPDSFCNTPMETGSQQEQVVAKDEDPEFKKLSDQLLEWEAELLDLEDKKRESMYKTEEVNVYGSKLSSFGQNVPDSFCNTPMETGSQQTSSAWDVDCTGVEASKSAAYQSMNVLHDDTPITTDSQQKQMETKGHQRAKQLKETYNHALPTIGMELPLHSFYSSMQIAPCLGECKRTPNVSVLHDTNCVLYNMPLLQELQNKNPKVLQQVKEHLTNINIDRDGFKNLLFHEKLSKMLDKIECAVKYIKHCSAKYLYLLTFKSQIKGFVKSSMPNMKKKKADFDELIHDLMQKDMSYYQLKVDIYNMLEIMSHHKYAEMVESYYHLLALESRINTFIENYKKVSESVKEKLDIQNNNPDFASHDWYDKYNAYINELINNLDADNSFLDNNSVFVAAPIISNPHLQRFYANMNSVFANRLEKAQRSPFLHLSRTSKTIYSLKKDLSIFLDEIEDLHVRFDKILDILASSEQSDGMLKDIIKEARAQILYSGKDHTKSYLSVKELGRIEISSDCSSTRVICLKLCMWLSLSRGEEACKTVKQEPTWSRLCKALGNKGHCLKEYIDYKEDLIYQFKEKWFPHLLTVLMGNIPSHPI